MQNWRQSAQQQQQRVAYLFLAMTPFWMLTAWLYPVLVLTISALTVIVALPFLLCYQCCCQKRRDRQRAEYRATATADADGADVEAGTRMRTGTPPSPHSATVFRERAAVDGAAPRRADAGVPNGGYEASVEEHVDAPLLKAALGSERVQLYAEFSSDSCCISEL